MEAINRLLGGGSKERGWAGGGTYMLSLSSVCTRSSSSLVRNRNAASSYTTDTQRHRQGKKMM